MPKLIDTIKKSRRTMLGLLKNQETALLSSIRTLEKEITERTWWLMRGGAETALTKRSIATASKVHQSIMTEFRNMGGNWRNAMNKDFRSVQKIIETQFGGLNLPLSFTTTDRDAFKALAQASAREFAHYGNDVAQAMIKDTYDYVIAGKPTKDIIENFRNHLTGVEGLGGRPMARYAPLKLQDVTMDYYSQMSVKKAKDAGLSKMLYYGNVIRASRPFCIVRVGRVFTITQIKSWDKLSWKGKNPYGTVIINRGGYNCRHSLHPIADDWIKDDKIEMQDWYSEAGGMSENLRKQVLTEEGKLGKFISIAPPTAPTTPPTPTPAPTPPTPAPAKTGMAMPPVADYKPVTTLSDAERRLSNFTKPSQISETAFMEQLKTFAPDRYKREFPKSSYAQYRQGITINDSAFAKRSKKAKLGIYNQILEAAESTLKRFKSTNLNQIGYTKKNQRYYGIFNYFLDPSIKDTRVGFQRKLIRNLKKEADKSSKYFAHRETRITKWKDKLADAKERGLKQGLIDYYEEGLRKAERSKRWTTYTGKSETEILHAVAKHEFYHAVDNTHGLRNNFQSYLTKHGVVRDDWYKVSEYAGSKIVELIAETGTALDLGIAIPENIKKAFLDMLNELGLLT